MNETFTLITKDGIRYEANNIVLSGNHISFLCSGSMEHVSIDEFASLELDTPRRGDMALGEVASKPE